MLKKQGFTLTEVLIAVLIIGILVGLALPHYASAIERSKCTYALGMLKSIRNAAILYYRENNSFLAMDLAALETLAGTSFFSDNSNPEWQFAIVNLAANSFDIRATRQRGQHAALFIEFSSDEQLGGSTYPWEDAGQF